MKVSKFGGSSVASKSQIDKVFNIVCGDESRKIIVVSAPGTRFTGDTKLTDYIVDIIENIEKNLVIQEKIEKIFERYREIESEMALPNDLKISHLISEQIHQIIKKYQHQPHRLSDALKSRGEYFNAILITNYFNQLGKKTYCLLPEESKFYVTDEPSNACVLDDTYSNLNLIIQQKLKTYDLIICPGFYGISHSGNIVTFSRGGSDITGSILARSMHADIYENFTDVSGIYSVNPNIQENPKIIDKMTYRELRELTYAGFNVFHDEALLPLIHQNTQIQIKNTNAPDHNGTTIMMQKEKQEVVGIASHAGFSSINIKKFLMNREIGFTRKLLSILETFEISYEHIPSGIDNLSVIVNTKDLQRRKSELIKAIHNTLNIDEINIEENIAIIMIVGEGMKTTIGTANKATSALKNNHINIKMINQGSSEISIMIGVSQQDEHKAVKALYQAYFE